MEREQTGWQIENSFARLPEILFSPAQPVRVRQPSVAILNEQLAAELGLTLDRVPTTALAALLAGHDLPDFFQPIAQAYAGHQFGSFTMLGDGRAILLGEQRTPTGRLVDIQLKGSGRTRFSRGGDGRAALGPMLREYVISEAMFALGIPTTRSLAVISTGEPVYRETVRKGAILVRVAASHIRVGTFEYLAARRDHDGLRALADYAIARHYPEIAADDHRYQALLRAVIDRQAALIARWQHVGFIHGVMNTDNMAISGETIDYGPCAFMNRYDPDTVFSSIDHAGRYAYRNQPAIALWNLARLAEALLPLLAPETDQAIEIATAILNEYPPLYEEYWLAGMRRKLGLQTADPQDAELIQSLLVWMHEAGVDFTNTFRGLSSGEPLRVDPATERSFQHWHATWQQRLALEQRPRELIWAEMRSVNPAVIPRNHRVEEALLAAEEADDLSPLRQLVEVLQSPFALAESAAEYAQPPADDCNYRTFCGT